MRSVITIVAALLIAVPAALKPAAAVSPDSGFLARPGEPASLEAIQRWVSNYRAKPDPAGVPAAVRAMARLGAFKDPEAAGTHVGFIAGVLGAHPAKAEELVVKMLPLPDDAQWVVVRAIAYSGLHDWKTLLSKFADRLPARKVMIERQLANKLPTLWQVKSEQAPSAWTTVKGYTIDKITGKEERKEVVLEPTAELIDTFWGYYFATGSARAISRIVAMLPWSREEDSVEKLTLGSMAKFTLAANAARDAELLALLKRTREHQDKVQDQAQGKAMAKMLDEIIEAAETVEAPRIRKLALAAIEDLKRKGPGSRRNATWWGQLGQGALAVGCIAAAATGHVELGLPCVITGGVSSAALAFWEKQP
jgi:hypothetical protein